MEVDLSAKYPDMKGCWNEEWARVAMEYYWRTHAHYAAVEQFLHGTVLDVGCGPGFLAARTFPNIGWYTGVDISEKAIELAKWLFPGAHFFVVDVEHEPLPFGDSCFETVVCSETVEHLSEHGLLLRELRRVARTYIVVTVPTSMGSCGHVYPKWTYQDLIDKFSCLGTFIEVRVYFEASFNLCWIRK